MKKNTENKTNQNNNIDINFLTDLTSCISPSGMESDIQKIWISYIEKQTSKLIKSNKNSGKNNDKNRGKNNDNNSDKSSDENSDIVIEKDHLGNVYAIINPLAQYTVLLAAHCDEVGYMVTKIEDEGFIRFTQVGGPVFQALPGTHVVVKGLDKLHHGVIGIKAGHHGGIENDLKIEDLYIDCGAQSARALKDKIRPGCFAVSLITPTRLMNNLFTARGLDNRASLFMFSQCIIKLASLLPDVKIVFASTINEEVGADGARGAVMRYNPDLFIGCDVTFATDYPEHGNNNQPECKLGKGPVISYSSKVSRKVNSRFEKIAAELKIPLQCEVLPGATGTDIDRARAVSGGQCALLSIPLRYMHSPVEVVSLKDIQMCVNLLCAFLSSLNSKDDFSPIKNI
jgi:endoglucanase